MFRLAASPPFAHLDDLSDMLWWPQRPGGFQVPGWPVVFFKRQDTSRNNREMKKQPGCLGYRGVYIGDDNKPLYIPGSSRKKSKICLPLFFLV